MNDFLMYTIVALLTLGVMTVVNVVQAIKAWRRGNKHE